MTFLKKEVPVCHTSPCRPTSSPGHTPAYTTRPQLMHPPVCLLTLLAFPGSTHCTYTHSGQAKFTRAAGYIPRWFTRHQTGHAWPTVSTDHLNVSTFSAAAVSWQAGIYCPWCQSEETASNPSDITSVTSLSPSWLTVSSLT